MMILVAWILAAPDPPNVPLKQIAQPTACQSKIVAASLAFNSGLTADDAGDAVAAERFYKEAIVRDPTLCDAIDHLGRLARRAGRLEEAAAWYRKSLAINGDDSVARMNLASALLLQGKLPEAVAEVERGLAHSPGSAEMQYSAAAVYLGARDAKKGLVAARRAEELYAKEQPALLADAQLLEGFAHFQLHDCGAARGALAGLEKEKGDHPEYHYILGICLVLDHRDELARGASASAPWVDQVRSHLRKAKALGKDVPPDLVKAFDL